jgi:hypothetical protein
MRGTCLPATADRYWPATAPCLQQARAFCSCASLRQSIYCAQPQNKILRTIMLCVTTGDYGPVPSMPRPVPQVMVPPMIDNRTRPPITPSRNPRLGCSSAHCLDIHAQPATPCTETSRGATCATQPASASLHRLHRLAVVTAVVPYAHYTHPAMHPHGQAEAKPQNSKD